MCGKEFVGKNVKINVWGIIMKCETLDVWKKALNLSVDVYKAFARC